MSDAEDGVEPGEPAQPAVRKLADEEQTRNRLAILNEFFKGMLLLNGGACIALLAFVQAIWEKRPPDFLHLVVYSMACFLAGLVFSVAAQFARYKISLHLQFGRRRGTWWRRAYGWLVALSILAFVGGATVILTGLYSAPPPPTPPEFSGRPQLPP